MLKNRQVKLDKFYLIFIGVMILLTVLVIYTFKTVFSSFFIGYEVEKESELSSLKVDEKSLNEAYDFAFNKENVKLEIK